MEERHHKLWNVLDVFFSHEAYRIGLLLLVTLRSCQLLNPYIGPLVKWTLLWAAAILVRDLFTKRLLFRNRFRGVLILFLLAYGVTCLTQIHNQLARNVVMLFYMTANLMVVYAYDPDKKPAAVKEELLRLCHSFMYLTFSGHLISLVAFVMNVRYRFTYMEGEFERRCWLGFYNGRLWGFFTNPNAASNFAVLNLMMMVICLTILGRGITQGRKRFYAANFLVQSLIFFLSNSRSSWLCVYFFLLIAPFLGLMYGKDHPVRGKKLVWKTMIRRAAAVAAAAVLLYTGGDTIAKDLLPHFIIRTNYFSQQLAQLPGSDMPDADEEPELEEIPTNLEREDFGAKLGGRYYLWRAGALIVKNHPLLGVGAENIEGYAKAYAPRPVSDPTAEPYLPGVQDGLHNILLQIAASSGLVGLLLMGAMAVGFLWRLVRYAIWACKKKCVCPTVLALGALILTMLFRSMTETGLIYGMYYTSIVFWSAVGATLCLIEQQTAGDPAWSKQPLLARAEAKIFRRKAQEGVKNG